MSQQINLFNPIFRRRGFSFATANSLLGVFGVVVATAMSYGFYQDYRTREMVRQAQEVARQHAEATALREKLSAQQAGQKPNAALDAEINQLESRLQGRQEIVNTLGSGAVGTTGGFSEYMRAFSRQTISGLWLTGFDIASSGNELLIQGRALSADLVPGYLKRLNLEPVLHGRQFAALTISQPRIDPAAVQREPVAMAEKKAAQAAKAESPARDDKAAKGAAPALPRYLEFSISTGASAEAGHKTPVAVTPPPFTNAEVPGADVLASSGQAGGAK